MMRNVCFFNSVKFWGGGERFYFDYALGFKKKGYNVFVVCDKDSVLSQKAREHGLPQFNVSVNMLSALNPFKVLKLVRFFQREQIEAVVFSTSQDLKLGGLTAKLAKVPNIAYRRGLAAPVKNRLVNRIIFRDILTHILANSQETKRTILQNLSDYIDANKIKVIYNGVKIDDTNPHQPGQIDAIRQHRKGIVLGNAGRLTAQKGQKYLIEIAKALKEKNIEFSLFIAGSGEMQEELEALIAENNLQNEVFLLGFVEDMESYMNSIDIFLLTSIWEGFGYVLVEAMMQSKPIVAFNITSNPEIVLKDKTGFLVEYPDVEAFTQKTQLLIENPALRQQLGETGKKSVKDRFRIEDRITEFENFLKG
ncbi:glycosyltransferase family 4 protein [Rapidithrix thailandica]|uniref:Glycosyltransferase family 4 protein n=1 Tax=Rapidithrix thailandica TaxID=413964 RepID=A0AAW9S0U1_9BACT